MYMYGWMTCNAYLDGLADVWVLLEQFVHSRLRSGQVRAVLAVHEELVLEFNKTVGNIRLPLIGWTRFAQITVKKKTLTKTRVFNVFKSSAVQGRVVVLNLWNRTWTCSSCSMFLKMVLWSFVCSTLRRGSTKCYKKKNENIQHFFRHWTVLTHSMNFCTHSKQHREDIHVIAFRLNQLRNTVIPFRFRVLKVAFQDAPATYMSGVNKTK